MNPVGPIVSELSGLTPRPPDTEPTSEEFAAALLAASLPRSLPVSRTGERLAAIGTKGDPPAEATVLDEGSPRRAPQIGGGLVPDAAVKRLALEQEASSGKSLVTNAAVERLTVEGAVPSGKSLALNAAVQRPPVEGAVLSDKGLVPTAAVDRLPVEQEVSSGRNLVPNAAVERLPLEYEVPLEVGRPLLGDVRVGPSVEFPRSSNNATRSAHQPAGVNDLAPLMDRRLTSAHGDVLPVPESPLAPTSQSAIVPATGPTVFARDLMVSIPLESTAPAHPIAPGEGIMPIVTTAHASVAPRPASYVSVSTPLREIWIGHTPNPPVPARDLMISTPLASLGSDSVHFDAAQLAKRAHRSNGFAPPATSIPSLPEQLEVRVENGGGEPRVLPTRSTTPTVDHASVRGAGAEPMPLRLDAVGDAESSQPNLPPLASALAGQTNPPGQIESRPPTEVPIPIRAADVEHALDMKSRSEVTVRFTDESGNEGRLRVAVRGSELRATLVTNDHSVAERLSGDITEIRRTLQERGFHDPRLAVEAAQRSAESENTPLARGSEERSTGSEHRRESSREQQQERDANRQGRARNRFNGSNEKESKQ